MVVLVKQGSPNIVDSHVLTYLTIFASNCFHQAENNSLFSVISLLCKRMMQPSHTGQLWLMHGVTRSLIHKIQCVPVCIQNVSQTTFTTEIGFPITHKRALKLNFINGFSTNLLMDTLEKTVVTVLDLFRNQTGACMYNFT